jgi:hypothetical protein
MADPRGTADDAARTILFMLQSLVTDWSGTERTASTSHYSRSRTPERADFRSHARIGTGWVEGLEGRTGGESFLARRTTPLSVDAACLPPTANPFRYLEFGLFHSYLEA